MTAIVENHLRHVDIPPARPGWVTDEVLAGLTARVFTGGEGRIPRGLAALETGWAPRLFVSGVDREVKPAEFAAEYQVPAKTMGCCVALGFQSYDTRSNASEVATWLAQNGCKSVRLVTSDWHMRRSAGELEQVLPHVRLVEDAVPSEPSLMTLFLEYHKLLASWLGRL